MIRAKTSSSKATYSQSHRFLWWSWTEYWEKYGWFKDITLSSSLSKGTELFDTYPKFTASSTSYSLGAGIDVSASGVSAGISAGVSFSSNAIGITNNSNSRTNKVNISIHHNVSWWMWDWERFKYAQQENCQLFTFSVLSDSKTSKQTLTFNSEFGTSGSIVDSVWAWGNIYVGSSAYSSNSVSINY